MGSVERLKGWQAPGGGPPVPVSPPSHPLSPHVPACSAAPWGVTHWRVVPVFDDNCSLNNCLSILCQQALNLRHAVSSVLANIQFPPDRSPRTVRPRNVRMSPAGSCPPCRWGVSVATGPGMRAHSPCIVGAPGGSRQVRRRCSCSLKMQTFRGAPAPHNSKDCAPSQSGRRVGGCGGPLGRAPRRSGQQGLQSEEQDAVRVRECLGGKSNSTFGVKAHPPRMVGQNLERMWFPLTLHSLCRSGLFHSVFLFFLSFSLF